MTGKTTPARRRAQWLALVIVWGSLLIAGVIVLGPPLWTYARGEPTIARVESCQTSTSVDSQGDSHEETTWYGSWTAGGTWRSGAIDGAHRGMIHQDVHVRAHGDGVATMNTIGRSATTAGIMAAIGVIAHFACYRAIVRQAGGGRG